MKPTLLIAALTSVALLAGCAGKVEPQYPPKELRDFAQSAALDSVWDEQVGDGLSRATYPIAPARDGDRVFAADAFGTLMALDADNGDTAWETDLDVPISSGLTAMAGEVYLGTRNGEVLAIDQRDGSVNWRARVPSEVLAAPQPNQQLLVVQSIDGSVTALDRATGQQRWTYSANRPSLTLRGTGTPQVIDPVTFAGFANGRLVTIDNRDGRVLNEQRIAVPQGRSDIERLVDLAAQPVLTQDGRLFVTSYNGKLVALDATRGELLWQRDYSSYLTPVLVGDTLFSVDESGEVLAVNAANGNEVWRNDDLTGRKLTAPAYAGDHLVFGDFEGYLHLIEPATGAIVGRERIDRSGISVRPLTEGRRIFALANDGSLEALDIAE
ncbi:outer membrane protein assembly factor BamB [Halomonas korlensis]|uniref:Outer membrane protein assembly factor BamB n=1 Tax=Halomonas korlensis TaxID=463301 RepID=A0A1I7I804_9GAMM|nr:outer membrane protein assembly factor BamB [Halomonas korlensis]SFU68916.1 Beta-barrel assembly machine subunit BamB [Halomonas korlensis]